VDSKEKEPPKSDSIPPKTQESVYYAKEGREKTSVETLVQRGGAGKVKFHFALGSENATRIDELYACVFVC
jgi:hypothetical protein